MVKQNYDRSLNLTWLLIITPEGVDPCSAAPNNSTLGGAVCIHPDGLLISSARNFSPGCHVKARGFSETGFRHLESLQVFPNMDLALGWVSKNTPDETFPFTTLTDGVDVVPGQNIFAHMHAGRLPYSSVFGHTSYELPKDVLLPPIGRGGGVVPTLATLDKKEKCRYQSAKHRAVGIFVGFLDGEEEEEEEESVDDLMGMHPDLPLIQGYGLCSASDSAGCPVFKEVGRELIGIMSFSKCGFQWVIPVQVLYHFVQTVLGPIGAIVRPSAPTSDANA